MREFLFEYHFGGLTWGTSVFASDPTEAREKIKAIGMAQYKGEISARVRVPGSGKIARFIGWLKSPTTTDKREGRVSALILYSIGSLCFLAGSIVLLGERLQWWSLP